MLWRVTADQNWFGAGVFNLGVPAYTEFPFLNIFPLHNLQKRDCPCILAHTFGIGFLLLMQPHTTSSMVWQVLLLETFKTAFVCLLIYCDETVHFLPVCSFTKPPLLQESRHIGGGSPYRRFGCYSTDFTLSKAFHSMRRQSLGEPPHTSANECVALPLGTYSTKRCLSLKKMYSLYSLWMFPHCLSVASEAPLRTRKGCMQLITSHDNKTNVLKR